MVLENAISLLGSAWTDYQRLVREALHSDIKLLDNLNESLLRSSGKQLRPLLSLLMAGALGGISEDSAKYAAAAEILHNATLLHDDVVDGADTRRGKPTLASTLGPSPAVLVGDFWLSAMVKLVIGTAHRDEAIKLYSSTLSHLAEGEMLQMEKAAAGDTTEEDYYTIIYDKTASLFEVSCLTGALSAGADGRLYEAAGSIGRALGIAFQIRDDILDYGDPSGLGKPVGQDLAERKITLPLLGALKGCDDEARIRGMVADIDSHPEYCGEIAGFVLSRGGVEYAARALEEQINCTLDALTSLPESPFRDALGGIARYLVVR